jgi:hypothetical protein
MSAHLEWIQGATHFIARGLSRRLIILIRLNQTDTVGSAEKCLLA